MLFGGVAEDPLVDNLHTSIREKPEDPQFEPHAGIKIVQVLGSPLHICGFTRSEQEEWVVAKCSFCRDFP